MKKFPSLPLTALIFYITVFVLWNLNLIPPPSEIVTFLESLYNRFGYVGLFIASFLEGTVYIGLYFPGAFIIALTVFLSDGSLMSLFYISLVTAAALTITSTINYLLGRYLSHKIKPVSKLKKTKGEIKGLLLAMIHPNSLAFYFFNEGINKKSFRKIFYVPIVMIPYGFLFALMLWLFSAPARQKLEDPYFLFGLILAWFLVSLFTQKKKGNRKSAEI